MIMHCVGINLGHGYNGWGSIAGYRKEGII